MSPREPRCHQNGMDARRRDADARFGGNPSGAGWTQRSALLPRPGVYQHTASSASSPAPRPPARGHAGS